ncbi:hypothetical protein [Pedobacter glucosidilyticus]|uniref:hypothetical protein n=1 Tax=Pedobacter glucosidilyticus TaxID=1122941 RepID=UPI00047CBD2E|nr:hypothetical protein [Pedobacter glucosidilyticus]
MIQTNFLCVISNFVFAQQKTLQKEKYTKDLLTHKWLIKKAVHNGKTVVMHNSIKAYMIFAKSGILTFIGGGQVEEQSWTYIPAKRIIKLRDLKTKEDLGDLEIIKVDTKELVIYNKPDNDLIYLVRVD